VKRAEINPGRLAFLPVRDWQERWFLLASGDFASGAYNFMTVAWGGLGCMWERPLAMIVVRPTRYTYELLEKYPDFTLCQFPKEYSKQLAWCGANSGRKVDKVKHTGLTPTAGRLVAAPVFAEAELVLECRKIYWSDFDPAHFLADYIEGNYPDMDYHRVYFGEILAAAGTAAYQG
jgi:flavin reductase (DIM6/NTAB) family NADH-FMN oxidoreductase RutF